MNFLKSVSAAIHKAISDDDRPVVVFSSAWPFLKVMNESNEDGVKKLLDIIIDAVGDRGLLMPTFTNGYHGGFCDLNQESSSTGVLSECFRKRSDTLQTLSAFFSFSVLGKIADEVIYLKPRYAWGEGSLYEWMEQRDVCFLLLGTHPTHCSYLHRMEWLARDVINYRFNKEFNGVLIKGGFSIELHETLFVRRMDPPVLHDFTVLLPFLECAGMKKQIVNGISVASYYAKSSMKYLLPAIQKDPYLTVINRYDYEGRS
jgi:aminoglycoside N3'-acetyltransferase